MVSKISSNSSVQGFEIWGFFLECSSGTIFRASGRCFQLADILMFMSSCQECPLLASWTPRETRQVKHYFVCEGRGEETDWLSRDWLPLLKSVRKFRERLFRISSHKLTFPSPFSHSLALSPDRLSGEVVSHISLWLTVPRGLEWAAIYGVAQSWTQLKRLSSSSSRVPRG